MTTDPFATVLWQEGMEIDSASLNAAQRQVRAQLSDQILEKLIGSINGGVQPEFGGFSNAPIIFAYATSVGSASLQFATQNRVALSGGTLFQKIGPADGVDSTFIAFTFAGATWPAFAAGATNPRVDLLQMKLEYITDTSASLDFEDAVTRTKTTTSFAATKRRVQCTLSIKSGAPDVSPTIPDPDAGFVPVGMAVIGPSWVPGVGSPGLNFGVDTSGSGAAAIYDLRMPTSVRAHRTDPSLFKIDAAWSYGATAESLTSTNATNQLRVMCQFNPGRIVGIGIEIDPASFPLSSDPVLGLMGNPDLGGSFVIGNKVINPSAGGPGPIYRYFRRDFEANHNPVVGPILQESVVNKIGVPIWTSGGRVAQDATSQDWGYVGLLLSNVGNGKKIGAVTFYVAEGL